MFAARPFLLNKAPAALAGVAALAWLAQVARTMVLREERVLAAENPPILQN